MSSFIPFIFFIFEILKVSRAFFIGSFCFTFFNFVGLLNSLIKIWTFFTFEIFVGELSELFLHVVLSFFEFPITGISSRRRLQNYCSASFQFLSLISYFGFLKIEELFQL